MNTIPFDPIIANMNSFLLITGFITIVKISSCFSASIGAANMYTITPVTDAILSARVTSESMSLVSCIWYSYEIS